MPRRSDIDPVDIWPLLPYIHISEWHTNPEGIFIRIAGTEIVASAGREFRGRWLSDIHEAMSLDPVDREHIMSLYHRVVATERPILGRTEGGSRLGVASFEWILCPLSEDGETVTHFIGLEDYVSQRRYLGGLPQ